MSSAQYEEIWDGEAIPWNEQGMEYGSEVDSLGQYLKETHRYPLLRRETELPVILITGFDTEETRALAKQSGAAGYFRKPVDDRALLDAIRWALSRRS